MRLTRFEKLMFPLFLFVFEIIFLILYGLLVRYDDGGSPHHDLTLLREHLATGGDSDELIRSLVSTLSTTKTYPCKFLIH